VNNLSRKRRRGAANQRRGEKVDLSMVEREAIERTVFLFMFDYLFYLK
jgi:hypothetical protein